MNKKRASLILLILIVILTAGGFFWWKNRETPPEKWDTAKFSPGSDYAVEETSAGKTVRNNKTGISFEVPPDWSLKESTSFLPDLTFYKDGTEVNQNRNDILDKGCRINVATAYIKTNVDIIETEVRKKEIFNQPTIINEYKTIEVDNQKSLRHTFQSEIMKIYFDVIHIPANNKVYEISLNAAQEDKAICEEDFNRVLGTVSIKK